MKRSWWMGGAAAVLVALTSCGGGGGSSPAPGPTPPPSPPPAPLTDDDARRAVLGSLGDQVILPAYRSLASAAEVQRVAVEALAAAPSDAGRRTAAQAAWKTAMAATQRAELLQIGPSAFVTERGGRGLRLRIYPYLQFDACAIHQAAYAEQPVDDASPLARTGMGALEYVLFADADDPACPPAGGVDGRARRAAYAGRLAARIAAGTVQLRDAWEPSGGNFINELKTAGLGSMAYSTPQMAMDSLAYALFYLEKQTKDRKIASATGIGATEVVECPPHPTIPTTGCPGLAESRFARTTLDNLRNNIEMFRDMFTGLSGGAGLNTLLDGVGRSDLRARLMTMIELALAGGDALSGGFEAAIADLPDRNACILASINRSGEPAVCRFHGLVDEVSDTLRAEVVSTLNLRVPDYAAGDND